MKVLTCEICESTDLIKVNDVFVCQSCGAKYSVEEAKKILFDTTTKPVSVVQIDSSTELKNLYEIARRSKENNNSENALKYYDMILIKDPSSWEANFYVVYFRAMSCKIIEIQNAAISMINSIDSTLDLVKNNVTETEKQNQVITEIYLQLIAISEMLYSGAENHYNNIDISIKDNYVQEYVNNVSSATDIMYLFGNSLVYLFGDTYGIIASESWKKGITMHNGYIRSLQDKESNKNLILQYAKKIKIYDSNYQPPIVDTSSSGCYIATAVYGSYDCPEVWVLRRYRDYTLSEIWYGRLFIKYYYTISPTIVKWFGKMDCFGSLGRTILDKFVDRLYKNGVNNTPYQDKSKFN